ncbi:hypothetical protein T06_13387 [Trichinella sp. T6]|nr:hypothetical protein T06_13387 [Trichinella sp. T6]
MDHLTLKLDNKTLRLFFIFNLLKLKPQTQTETQLKLKHRQILSDKETLL